MARVPHESTALSSVVESLGDRVAPVVMAHERTLPVPDQFGELFVDGGLVRGRVLSCDGVAATSTALALVAPSVAAGSWLAIVGVPNLGLDAAGELGVPLERVVHVELGDHPERIWAEVVAAAADGFEVVLTRVPEGVRPATARTVASRLQQRGVVVVVLGTTGALTCDGVLTSSDDVWEGLGEGHGYLRRRSVRVEASGRRIPGVRRCRVDLPAGTGPAIGRAEHREFVRAG